MSVLLLLPCTFHIYGLSRGYKVAEESAFCCRAGTQLTSLNISCSLFNLSTARMLRDLLLTGNITLQVAPGKVSRPSGNLFLICALHPRRSQQR